jgi:PAB-dependent poly(A)-specific ribonuclease subunit 3
MVGSTYSLPSGRPNFYSSSSQSLLPEPLLWSYIIQLTGALRTIHEAGLAARVIFPSKILVSGRSRLLLSCAGLLDVLAYENGSSNSATVARHQQDDLMALGQTLLALACNNSMAAIQRENIPKALEAVALNYSSDLKNLILFVSFLTICSLCNLLFICLLSDIFLAVNNLYVLLMK